MRRLTHWVPTLICSLIRAETNILKFQFKAEAAATVTRADLKAVELLFHPNRGASSASPFRSAACSR